jgi:hypothetical protein
MVVTTGILIGAMPSSGAGSPFSPGIAGRAAESPRGDDA